MRRHDKSAWLGLLGLGVLAGGAHGATEAVEGPPPDRPSLEASAPSPAPAPSRPARGEGWVRGAPEVVAATAGEEPAAPRARAEQELAREARLPTILALALARSPEVGEGAARTEAARAAAREARGWLAPELRYEQWGLPLDRPFAYGHAEMLMLGVRQTLRPWGAGRALARMEEAAVKASAGGLSARRLDVAADVRRAHARYFAADHEARLHQEHSALTAALVTLARGHYQTGQGSQQDVLRLELELAGVHAELTGIEQERRAAAATLNALMGRSLDAPLGPAPAFRPSDEPGRSAAAPAARPELASAAAALEQREAALELARTEARYPTVMLGLDYQRMPRNEMKHGFGAMISLGLPWLTGARRAAVEKAEALRRAEEHAAEATRRAVGLEAREAEARVIAARASWEAIERELLPRAHAAFQAGRAAYASGGRDAYDLVDSLRSYLQVRIERVRALARLQSALAERDRALGTEGTP